MEPFITHAGVGVPLRRSNVDTDQIVPAEWLKRVSRTGFEDGLFARWRKETDFVLNQAAYASGSVLVAGPDFGTGSSREHAVWALQQYGFKVVIASRFGDIFRGNSGKSGLLCAEVAQDTVTLLWEYLENHPGAEVHVSLQERTIRADNLQTTFQIDDYTAWRLMHGLDDISLTLRHNEDIARFEALRPAHKPIVTTAVTAQTGPLT